MASETPEQEAPRSPTSCFPKQKPKHGGAIYIQPESRLYIAGTSAASSLEGKQSPCALSDVQLVKDDGGVQSITRPTTNALNINQNWSVSGVDFRHTKDMVIVRAELISQPSTTRPVLQLKLRRPTPEEMQAHLEAQAQAQAQASTPSRKRIRNRRKEAPSDGDGDGDGDGEEDLAPLPLPDMDAESVRVGFARARSTVDRVQRLATAKLHLAEVQAEASAALDAARRALAEMERASTARIEAAQSAVQSALQSITDTDKCIIAKLKTALIDWDA